MEIIKQLVQQKWFQFGACLFVGVAIGALFYPQTKTELKIREEMRQEYSLKEEEIKKVHDEETKRLTDQITSEETSHRQVEQEMSVQFKALITENDHLKQSTHHQTFRLVKPDGTIIEKEMDSSDTESSKQVVTEIKQEFDQKVKSIEDKWKKIHEQRVAELTKKYDEELKKAKEENKTTTITKETTKTVETNQKKLRPEIGITTNQDVYIHASYSLWGPVFLGGGVSGSRTGFGEARVGVGIEL